MGNWNNVSQKEAQESYDSANQRYKKAAYEYGRTRSRLEACSSEYSSEKHKLDTAAMQKVNFEKRIEQLGEIIRMLSDGGVVDEAVKDVNSAAKKAEEALSGSIKCSGINNPSLSVAFRSHTVSEVQASSEALMEFRREKSRLENAVANLNKQMRAMEETVDNLSKQMSALSVTQMSIRRTMNSSAHEMNHFKKYL